jgi:hypothetical protein
LWATLLVALSPFNLWYSQEVRMYTLGAVLGLAALWCALNALERFGIPRYAYLAGYVLAAAAGLYVLYYFGFLLVTLNLLAVGYLLWRRNLRDLGVWLLTQAAVLMLYLPWLPFAWRQATEPPVPPWRGHIPLPAAMVETWTALSLGQSVQPGQVWPILLVTGILFLLGVRSQRGQSADFPVSQSSKLLIAYTFGPLLLIYLVSLITPLHHVRYMFTYAPAFYIVLGAGLVWLGRRIQPLAIAAAVVLLIGSAYSIYELHTNPRYVADDFRGAVRFIADHWRPGDAVLVNAGYAYTGFLYYYDGPVVGPVRLNDSKSSNAQVMSEGEGPLLLTTGIIDGDPNLGWGDPRSDFYSITRAETASDLEGVTRSFPRLWMLRIYDTVADPEGFIRDWLEANTIPFEDQLFAGEASMRVQGFMSNTQPPPPSGAEVPLEGGVSLVSWQAPQTAVPGKPLDVVLWWQVDASSTPNASEPATPYAVSLKLWTTGQEGTEGHLIAQQDEWPVGSLLFTPDWPPGQPVRYPMRLWLPTDLPPGRYQLEVEMYDPATVQPLSRRDGQGHTIRLETVTATPGQ